MSDNIIDNACEDNARARIPLAEISFSKSLKTLASDIRAATQAVDAAAVHRFIGCVNTLGAVTNLTRKLNLFPGPDLGVTDISGLDILRADWGGGMYGQAGSHPPSYQREEARTYTFCLWIPMGRSKPRFSAGPRLCRDCGRTRSSPGMRTSNALPGRVLVRASISLLFRK